MRDKPMIPVSLKVVAYIFILGGVFSLIEVIVSLMNSHINLHFGVLGLFIGSGLLRLNSGWRHCALVFLWMAMIGTSIFAILCMASSEPIGLKVFGQDVGYVSKGFTIIFVTLVFSLTIWQYRVLMKSNVRRLFEMSGS